MSPVAINHPLSIITTLQMHTIDSLLKDHQHVKCRNHSKSVGVLFVKMVEVMIVEYTWVWDTI